MRRFLVVTMITLGAVLLTADAMGARVRVVERGGRARTRVVVHAAFPIHRSARMVVLHRRPVVVAEPLVYARPILWAPVVVALPPRDRLVWEDSETLVKSDGWTETTLEVNDRGDRLYLELTGRTQLDWAEVVFANGQAEAVDFRSGTYHPGIYSLLDFRDGRMVRYVRLVARARSLESRVILRLQK